MDTLVEILVVAFGGVELHNRMSCVSDCVVCRFFFLIWKEVWESCASKTSHKESRQRHSKIRREGMHFSSGSDKKG